MSEAGKAKYVVNCGQMLTLAGPARARCGNEMRELEIIADGAMVVANGRVVAVGKHSEICSNMPAGAQVINAGGRVVMPGFVDAHTHPVFGGNRVADFEKRIAGSTYQEIAASGGGIASTLKMTRAASEAELLCAAKKHAEWFLRGGTTTIEAKSGYGLTRQDELKSLRVLRTLAGESQLRIVPTLLAAHIVPPEFRDDREGYLRMVMEYLIPEAAATGLARHCDVFCDEHAFSMEETRRVQQKAASCGLGLRMHVEQFGADGGAALAAELGAATADHLECTDATGIAALRAASVQPVLLPASVFALGRTQYPNARAMMEAGLAVVVASDFNPGSSPTTSMTLVLALAALYMGMLPSETIVASTINAAASLALAHEIGSLETGKRADFVIHECEDYRDLMYFLATPSRPRVFVGGCEVV